MGHSTVRNQHYVPQMYLRQFCAQNGRVWVFDLGEKRRYPASPRNIASQRDFYRVDVPDEPMAIENVLGDVEGRASGIIDEVLQSRTMPHGEKYEDLMMFLALQHMRGPRPREAMKRFYRDIGARMIEAAAASPQVFEATKRRLLENGADVEDVTLEDLQGGPEMIEQGILEPVDDATLVLQSMTLASRVQPCFAQRNWTVLVARARDCGFVTSDHPIVLKWTAAPAATAPALGFQGTEVIVTLGPALALRGVFETCERSRFLTPEAVASVNTAVLQSAQDRVFSATERFRVKTPNGMIWSDSFVSNARGSG